MSLYKRNSDGTEKMRFSPIDEVKVKTNGNFEIRQRQIVGPEVDDDFPAIGDAYEEFRKKHKEPGAMITRIEASRYRCFPTP